MLDGNRTPWCPATLGGLRQWHWGGRRSLRDGRGRWGAHLSLVRGQTLSSQQVALNQMDTVVHGGADKNGQGDRLHGAHLPAAPVHEGHHKAHDACRGREAAWTWPHPYSPGRGWANAEGLWGRRGSLWQIPQLWGLVRRGGTGPERAEGA